MMKTVLHSLAILVGFAWELPNSVTQLLKHPFWYAFFGCVDASVCRALAEVVEGVILDSPAYLLMNVIFCVILAGTLYQILFTDAMERRTRLRHWVE